MSVQWNEYGELIEKLGSKIIASGKKYTGVYGVPRGGMIVAVGISHILDIPVVCHVVQATKRTLIVDDISDSGGTLSQYNISDSDTATLFIDPNTKYIPTYYVIKNVDKIWINFPYEILGTHDHVSKVKNQYEEV